MLLLWFCLLNVIINGKCLKIWYGGILLILFCLCFFSDEFFFIWWVFRVCVFFCLCWMFSFVIWNKKKMFFILLKWNFGLFFWLIVCKKERKFLVINVISFFVWDRISLCGFFGWGLRFVCNLYYCNSFILSVNYWNIIVRI